MGDIFSKMKFELKIFYNEASNRSKTKTWKNLLQIEEDWNTIFIVDFKVTQGEENFLSVVGS